MKFLKLSKNIILFAIMIVVLQTTLIDSAESDLFAEIRNGKHQLKPVTTTKQHNPISKNPIQKRRDHLREDDDEHSAWDDSDEETVRGEDDDDSFATGNDDPASYVIEDQDTIPEADPTLITANFAHELRIEEQARNLAQQIAMLHYPSEDTENEEDEDEDDEDEIGSETTSQATAECWDTESNMSETDTDLSTPQSSIIHQDQDQLTTEQIAAINTEIEIMLAQGISLNTNEDILNMLDILRESSLDHTIQNHPELENAIIDFIQNHIT